MISNPSLRAAVEALALGTVLTTASYLVAWLAGWVTSPQPLEVFAVATSFACTWLCVQQRRINYPIGAISTAAYAVLFAQQGLVASALLNAYLTPALVYGWFRWRADADTRPVGWVGWRWWPVYLVVSGAFYAGAVWLLDALGASLAPVDAGILVGSMLAQFLLDNKRIETWAVWALVNVAAVLTYFNAGLPLAGLQYCFFLANAGFGAWSWWRTMRRTAPTTRSTFEVAA